MKENLYRKLAKLLKKYIPNLDKEDLDFLDNVIQFVGADRERTQKEIDNGDQRLYC